MTAQRLSRLSLRCLSALFGGVGLFLLWASCYSPRPIEAGLAVVSLGLAAGIAFAIREDR